MCIPMTFFFACKGPGVSSKEEEWKPNKYGWSEKCGNTGNLGYHCIHCGKDTETGKYPEVVAEDQSKADVKEDNDRKPAAKEKMGKVSASNMSKGTKRGRGDNEEVGFVFVNEMNENHGEKDTKTEGSKYDAKDDMIQVEAKTRKKCDNIVCCKYVYSNIFRR